MAGCGIQRSILTVSLSKALQRFESHGFFLVVPYAPLRDPKRGGPKMRFLIAQMCCQAREVDQLMRFRNHKVHANRVGLRVIETKSMLVASHVIVLPEKLTHFFVGHDLHIDLGQAEWMTAECHPTASAAQSPSATDTS